jgi:hypothetical protein
LFLYTIIKIMDGGYWWRYRDSNPRHADYDSAALTN